MSDAFAGLDPATVAIVAGRGAEGAGQPVNVPPVLTSIFKEGSDPLYARDGNPTWTAFEETLGALEGGTALVFASGMAAEGAVLDTLPLGAKVVAPDNAYYGTLVAMRERADKGLISLTTVDLTVPDQVVAQLEGAALLWLESPSNPLMGICDIERLSVAAHEAGTTVVVDNTFATPMLQRPLDLGADIVVHSVTKFISGHADIVMGAVIARDSETAVALHRRRSAGGAIAGPLETFLALRGLRTLPIRVEKGQANASELARRLQQHPKVTSVLYPGLPEHPGHELALKQMRGPGAMLSFLIDGGADDAERVCTSTEIIAYVTSLGGVETSMERRTRHPGETAPDNLIRLSAGCENVEDLWADLARALA